MGAAAVNLPNAGSQLNRRDLIAAVLGASAAALVGCDVGKLSSLDASDPGRLLSPNFAVGHQIRDRKGSESIDQAKRGDRQEKTSVLIVGGGIAGLSAAWQLSRRGIEDFVMLELESNVGGTARSGQSGSIRYPWGAHYVPVPMAENQSLISLLQKMEVITGTSPAGQPIVAEQYLCRQPQERVFFQGRWSEGLYPQQDASEEDLDQLQRFQQVVGQWADRRDARGRRLFAIPTSAASSGPEFQSLGELDRQSMADWMTEHGFNSKRLRWLVDYSCRDDYGVDASQVSAWAGLFYFAARLRSSDALSQEVITWPEGNGRIVNHLSQIAGQRIQSGQAVISISSDANGCLASVVDTKTGQSKTFRADRVIFAAPQFVAKYVIADFGEQRRQAADAFHYGSWLVANVHLVDRPIENGFPISWDNVIYGSRSLGYVNAVHQTGNDHGETVLTWYYPLSGVDASLSRQKLLSLGWQDWADVLLADLTIPHPDIAPLIRKIDFMRWGHAMVTPTVGFQSNPLRELAATPHGRIHFAASDLSGVALMEEALDHGVRAADEVTKALGHV